VVKENIVWLNIAMKDAERVNELESRGQTGDDKSNLTLTKALSGRNIISEISSEIKIHHKIAVQIIMISKMKVCQMRMRMRLPTR
jgi:hypothetical protein